MTPPTEPMNILVAIDKLTIDGTTPSCIALNLRDTRQAFLEQGCRLTVCNFRGNDPGSRLLQAAGMPVVELGLSSASPRGLSALLKAARANAAQLIHAHGYAAANFGRLAGYRLGLPVVVHEHAVLPLRPHQYLVDRALRRLTARGVAISQAVSDFMVRGRCVPPEKIEIIHNGIDLARFQNPATNREQARTGFGWPHDAFVVGSAARFRSEKGMDILVDAALRLAPQRPELFFALAGEGEARPTLQRQVEAAGESERIRLPGFIEDMPAFMRALDLLVIPSRQEGLCFAALEAMAAGVPVVAANVGGLPELIRDGVNGLLTPPGDSAALATAIARAAADAGLRRSLAAAGRQTAEDFSMQHYARRIADLYRRLLDAA